MTDNGSNPPIEVDKAVELKPAKYTQEQLEDLEARTKERPITPISVMLKGAPGPDVFALSGQITDRSTVLRVHAFVEDPNRPGKTLVDQSTAYIFPMSSVESAQVMPKVMFRILRPNHALPI